MKRALFDTVTVLPFESGSVTNRMGYESAILALTVSAGGKATVKVEHCDTDNGTFEAVPDTRLFVDNPVDKDGNAIVFNESPADAVANLNIDLIGCKEWVKITVTESADSVKAKSGDDSEGETASSSSAVACALVLGDATNQPTNL